MRERNDVKKWPITMTEAAHIARIPASAGSDAAIAREYGITETLVHEIRTSKGFNGVAL